MDSATSASVRKAVIPPSPQVKGPAEDFLANATNIFDNELYIFGVGLDDWFPGGSLAREN